MLFYRGRQRILDANGRPVSGALAHFTLTMTTTPADTFQDAGFTTPHANPVVANAAGFLPPIHLKPDVIYRSEITDALGGALPDGIVDPVNSSVLVGLNAGDVGKILYPQTAAEVSAGVTPVNYAYAPLDVRRYGNNASPGATDTTAAFQSALAVAAVYGGRVYAPADAGPYNITANLVVPSGVTLEGDANGALGTIIYHNVPGAGAFGITLGNSDTSLSYGCGLKNITLVFKQSTSSCGVLLRSTIGADLERVYVAGDGVHFTYTGFAIQGGSSVSSFFNTLKNCYAQHCHVGYIFQDLGVPCTQNTLIQCSAFGDVTSDPTSVGVRFAGANGSGSSSVFIGGNLEDCGKGVELSTQVQYTQWFGPRFEANTTDVVFVAPATVGRHTFFGPTNSFNYSGPLSDSNIFGAGNGVNNIPIGGGGDLSSINSLAIGIAALAAATGANAQNVAVGHEALNALTSGINGTAVGYRALKSATGNNNTAAGNTALTGVTTGAQNTGLGASAGSNLTTGGSNVALGYNSQCGQTGSNNTAVGVNAGTASSPHTIGAAESNRVVMGDSNVTNAYIQVAWTAVSDRRDKRDIRRLLGGGLSFIRSLKPIRYRMDDRNRYKTRGPRGGWKQGKADGSRADREESVGFSAQDVRQALKRAGLPVELLVDESNPKKLGLTGEKMIPFLVQAIQELSAEIDALKNRI